MLFGGLTSSIYVIKANKSYQAGNQEEALSFLEKAYKTQKAKAGIVTTYGYLLLKTGHLEEALRIFKEQLASQKIKGNDLFNLKSNYALALWKEGNLDKAITIYEEILPHFKNTNVYGSLGFLYILSGNLEKALKLNLEAVEYNDTGTVILDNLGQTYYLLGELEKADEIYQKLMSLSPGFPEAFYDYALVLEKLKKTEQAIEYLKKALLHKPNFLSVITTEQIEAKLEELEA